MSNSVDISQLVAHRGNREAYPENTVIAIESALRCGARYFEFDVQFSKDQVPMVVHDVELQRVTGIELNLFQLSADELAVISAHEPKRFGEKYFGEAIPKLQSIAELIKQWPDVKAFVEIKRATIKEFGVECVMTVLHKTLRQVLDQCVLISFNHEILQHKLASDFDGIGWVFDRWHEDNYQIALQLVPQYVFVDADCVPEDIDGLPDSLWQWVVYEVSDPETAAQWVDKGVSLIETDSICDML